MKTLEAMGEAIRNPKHPFRKTQHHSKKSLKNRHERRKIREFLQLGDWMAEETARIDGGDLIAAFFVSGTRCRG